MLLAKKVTGADEESIDVDTLARSTPAVDLTLKKPFPKSASIVPCNSNVALSP